MKVGVPSETFPQEQRVALIPAGVEKLRKKDVEVLVQRGAGVAAGYADADYEAKGATVVASRDEVFAADVIAQVRSFGANQAAGREDLTRLRSGQIVLGTFDPLSSLEQAEEIAQLGVTQFALELIPRITRAQSMDVLSSMATIAGYRAVMLAASHLPKMFPLMMTAAGTLSPAKVLVVGAGVAGLQAIAAARRLGAVVQAYDVRPTTREQIESLGGKFVQLDIDTGSSEDKGGYAKELGEAFYEKQRELLGKVVAESDVVITTAAIPGKRSPLLVTAAAVEQMHVGSVIIDLAAERGGNCELSQPDETVKVNGVTILGPTNTPAEIPTHASQMFSTNSVNFLLHLIEDGEANLDLEDEITRGTLLTLDGEVFSEPVRLLLGLPPQETPETLSESSAETASENVESNGSVAAENQQEDVT